MKTPGIIMLLACLALSALAGNGQARTWHVARDGSGDFIVIQDAVDAASEGDTIQIGPGQYTEYQTLVLPPRRVYVELGGKGEMTLIGAGAELTKIGPYTPDPNIDRANFGVRAQFGVSTLTLEAIGCVNLNGAGIAVSEARLVARACDYTNCNYGVGGDMLSGSVVESSAFSDCWSSGIEVYPTTIGLLLRDNTFSECWVGIGLHYAGVQGCVIEDCAVTGGFIGLQIDDGASGQVHSNSFQDQGLYCLSLLESGDVAIEDSSFVQGQPSYWYSAAWYVEGYSVLLLGRRNTLISEANCILLQGTPVFDMRDNHFLRGGDQAWYVYVPAPFDFIPYFAADLSGNWWGTDDPAEIAAWIHDEQDDPRIHVHVNFEPFLGGPVAGEEMTWGGVKNLFRGAK